MNITVSSTIHAEIITEETTVVQNTPVILDPLTNSYSDMGDLVEYELFIQETTGNITYSEILNNGKNSRLIVSGRGTITVRLNIEDELGNTATTSIVLNVI